ncbi:MAG: hypothetical protein IJO79_01865, partial [Firmicutes bacterium]|nr:hypothetical protein [Bacillota bacterium]
MSKIRAPLEFQPLRNAAVSARGTVNVSGISESRVAPVAALLFDLLKKQCLIVTSNYEKAKKLAGDLSFFAEAPVYCLPEEDSLRIHYDAKSRDGLQKRLAVMEALVSGKPCIVVLPASAAVKPLSPPALFRERQILLQTGEEVDLEELKQKLVLFGYERMSVAESPGQFALRGGILDVYPPGAPSPLRVEFFDTEVDSVRTYHPETQRSLEMLDEAVIYPASPFLMESDEFAEQAAERIRKTYKDFAKKLSDETRERAENRRDQLLEALETRSNLPLLENYIHYFYEEPSFLWDYMEKDGFVMVDDPDRVRELLELRDKEGTEDFKALMERGEAAPADADLFLTERHLAGIYRGRR